MTRQEFARKCAEVLLEERQQGRGHGFVLNIIDAELEASGPGKYTRCGYGISAVNQTQQEVQQVNQANRDLILTPDRKRRMEDRLRAIRERQARLQNKPADQRQREIADLQELFEGEGPRGCEIGKKA